MTVPAGAWAVGVSGGADSVALLLLLLERADLQLHVVHLDHQTRGAASTGDAEFVAQLAGSMGLPCMVRTLSVVESAMSECQRAAMSANPSAHYRQARHALFGQVIRDHQLQGVLLAHHADDQAETVLHRLMRGAGATGLAGMSVDTRLGDLRIVRPLLGIRRSTLRHVLEHRGQPWREDASNSSPDYLRSRLRKVLGVRPGLSEHLLRLGQAAAALRDGVRQAAPELPEQFAVPVLANLPDLLALESARRWLQSRGCPPDELGPPVLRRLLTMARDAASPARVEFPGQITVRRKTRRIWAEPTTQAQDGSFV